MHHGRLPLLLCICLLAGIARAEAPPRAPVQTTLRVIDGDRWLELDESARIDIPASLLSLQLTVRQQRQIRRILAAAYPDDDPQKAFGAFVSIRRVLDRRQQRVLQSRTDRDNGSGG